MDAAARIKIIGTTHQIMGVAADEAICVGDNASNPGAAIAPGYCPAIAVPVRTFDHVVAVAQRGNAVRAYEILRVATDKAIGVGDSSLIAVVPLPQVTAPRLPFQLGVA